MTTRTISSNEAKQRWGTVVSAVSDEGDEVIVASHSKPRVAVISYEAFEEYRAFREQKRRHEVIAWMREFEAEQAGRIDDLSEEEIERIAIDVGREVNQAIYERWRQRTRGSGAE